VADNREPLRSIHAGLGGRGRTHLKAAVGGGFWRPVAFVDPDPEALRKAREVVDVPESACFARLEDALAAVPADAVTVTAWPAAHAGLITTALAAGKHVLTEKAFTPEFDAAVRCVAEAERRDRKLMVVQNARLFPAMRTLRRLVGEQTYGPLGFFHMTFYKSRGAPYGRPNARIPQMHLWEQAVHELDTILGVVQQPLTRVVARSFNPVWCDWPSESSALVIADFNPGVSGAYVATSDARAAGFDFRLECASAALVAGRATGPIRVLFGPSNRREETLPVDAPDVRGFEDHPYARAALEGRLDVAADQVDALANLRIYRDFYDYIVDGMEPESSGRRNLDTIRFVEAVRRSSESGLPISLSDLDR
jgi:predicted dehydrogenase